MENWRKKSKNTLFVQTHQAHRPNSQDKIKIMIKWVKVSNVFIQSFYLSMSIIFTNKNSLYSMFGDMMIVRFLKIMILKSIISNSLNKFGTLIDSICFIINSIINYLYYIYKCTKSLMKIESKLQPLGREKFEKEN